MPRRRGQVAFRALAAFAALLALAVPEVVLHELRPAPGAPSPTAPKVPSDAPQPGHYRAVYRVTGVALPGIAPEVARGLRAMFAATGQERRFCYPQEAAAMGAQALVLQLAQGDCRTLAGSTAAGTLSADLRCREGRGMTASYRAQGTYDRDGAHVALKVAHSGPDAANGGQTIGFDVSATRDGPC